MRVARAVVYGSLGGLACVVALGLVQCKDATEIIVDVRTDDCTVRDTGISVGSSLSSLKNASPSAFTGRSGCEKGNRIGTLTIYPSGAKDAVVSFKVVTGVTRSAGECFASGDKGCIVATRKLRFARSHTQVVIVNMSRKCLDAVCPEGQTCNEGLCVGTDDISEDGGIADDASQSDASFIDGHVDDAGNDADDGAVDAGVDACGGCRGACDGGSCFVDCTTSPCTGELCAPTLPCTVQCPQTGSCTGVRCTSSDSCAISCTSKDACDGVTCRTGSCSVVCQGNEACHGGKGIELEAGSAELVCQGGGACATSASCNGGTCRLVCVQNGGGANCPSPAPCAGNCADWKP